MLSQVSDRYIIADICCVGGVHIKVVFGVTFFGGLPWVLPEVNRLRSFIVKTCEDSSLDVLIELIPSPPPPPLPIYSKVHFGPNSDNGFYYQLA